MDFNLILKRIKSILASEFETQKITLRMVSEELGFPPTGLYSKINRQSIPHKNILAFCVRKNILANWVYFGQNAEDVALATRLVAPKYEQCNNTH